MEQDFKNPVIGGSQGTSLRRGKGRRGHQKWPGFCCPGWGTGAGSASVWGEWSVTDSRTGLLQFSCRTQETDNRTKCYKLSRQTWSLEQGPTGKQLGAHKRSRRRRMLSVEIFSIFQNKTGWGRWGTQDWADPMGGGSPHWSLTLLKRPLNGWKAGHAE